MDVKSLKYLSYETIENHTQKKKLTLQNTVEKLEDSK